MTVALGPFALAAAAVCWKAAVWGALHSVRAILGRVTTAWASM
jgi:hypothetical protein